MYGTPESVRECPVLEAIRTSVSEGVMKPPHADDGVVHGVKGRPAARFRLNADPTRPVTILIHSVKPVLADHYHWVTALRLREYWL